MEDAEDGEWIRVRVGTTKSGTLRNIYSAVDEHYTIRSDANVQSEGDESDEDSDVRTDSSIATGVDAGAPDSGPEGEPDDSGESDSPTKSLGTEVDEGAGPDPDNAPESASRADVEPPSTQRVEPESRQGSSK